MNKLDLYETEQMSEQELDQYAAYCEEQDRLQKLYEEQEEKFKITRAIIFLESKGYKVEIW